MERWSLRTLKCRHEERIDCQSLGEMAKSRTSEGNLIGAFQLSNLVMIWQRFAPDGIIGAVTLHGKNGIRFPHLSISLICIDFSSNGPFQAHTQGRRRENLSEEIISDDDSAWFLICTSHISQQFVFVFVCSPKLQKWNCAQH